MRSIELFTELAKKRSSDGRNFSVYTCHTDDSGSTCRIEQARQLEEDGYILLSMYQKTAYECALQGLFTDKGQEIIREQKIQKQIY